eukprot:5944706-Pyramimonas_sp.AAC.1
MLVTIADHADDDDGVFTSVMEVRNKNSKCARGRRARKARILFDTGRATPACAQRRSNDFDMRARS